MGNKRKADVEHPQDAEREDGEWMRTEGNKRKSVEEEEESMSRKTVKYLRTFEMAETKKGSEGVQEIVEFAEVEVNEEEEEIELKTKDERQCEGEGGELVSEQCRQVKTREMFEFGLWEEATFIE